MFELLKLKKLYQENKKIFLDILGDMQIKNYENGKVIFQDEEGHTMTASFLGEYLTFRYYRKGLERHVSTYFPKDKREDVRVIETIKETRDKGCIVERVIKVYGYSPYSLKEKTVVKLDSIRYVFDYHIWKHGDLFSDLKLEKECLLKTVFECQMETFYKSKENLPLKVTTVKHDRVLLNGEDITALYVGKSLKFDKVLQIYDLYNGIINERNCRNVFDIKNGFLPKEGLGYKETSGITKMEDDICGLSKFGISYRCNPEYVANFIRKEIGYPYSFDVNNLASLIKAIFYQKTPLDFANDTLLQCLGISYLEYLNLDFDEQQRLTLEYHKKIKELNRNKQL